MKVLVCNVGSTSLKFKLFEMPAENVVAEGKIERVGSKDNAIFHYENKGTGYSVKLEKQDVLTYTKGINQFLGYLTSAETGVLKNIKEIERVGFKSTIAKNFYGIHEFTQEVIDAMEDFLIVAPVHNRPYIDAVNQFKDILPDAMLVGAFETAFHTTIPLERTLYGVPYEWYEKYGIQRFGYHGASHGYIADAIAEKEGKTGKLISCHLGGSSSVCAIVDGKSIDTTFGFSLQTGLPHANRTGDVDAYLFPFLMSQGMTMDEVKKGMDANGGLLGISGVSNDCRDISEAAAKGNKRAELALDMFAYSIVKHIGAYYGLMGGLDHLVFTAGIGENADDIRQKVCQGLSHLGIKLDEKKNLDRSVKGDRIISEDGAPVNIWIIPTNEELGVCRKTFYYGK